MTNRAFYEYVVAHVEDEEVKAKAQAWLDKEDASKATKRAENAVVEEAILSALGMATSPVTASEIGAEADCSTAKAAAVLKGLRASGKVRAIEEVKSGRIVRTYVLA